MIKVCLFIEYEALWLNKLPLEIHFWTMTSVYDLISQMPRLCYLQYESAVAGWTWVIKCKHEIWRAIKAIKIALFTQQCEIVSLQIVWMQLCFFYKLNFVLQCKSFTECEMWILNINTSKQVFLPEGALSRCGYEVLGNVIFESLIRAI